jgi:tetratricopeptide (TPR) repeat protein
MSMTPTSRMQIAGRPELARDYRLSLRRILGWSLLGSSFVVLIALAARPALIEDTEARIDQALELYGKGDRDGARQVAADLARTDPTEPRVWLLLGMLAEDRKAIADAEQAYSAALDLLEPADVRRLDVEVTLADLRRRKGDPAGALGAIDKLARERGESGRIRHARVLSLIDLGRFDDALRETRLIAEERFSGGIAKKLEKHIRSLMGAEAPRDD